MTNKNSVDKYIKSLEDTIEKQEKIIEELHEKLDKITGPYISNNKNVAIGYASITDPANGYFYSPNTYGIDFNGSVVLPANVDPYTPIVGENKLGGGDFDSQLEDFKNSRQNKIQNKISKAYKEMYEENKNNNQLDYDEDGDE